VLIENDARPSYLKGGFGPDIVAAMTRVGTRGARGRPILPLGVQVLAGANLEALAWPLASAAQRSSVS